MHQSRSAHLAISYLTLVVLIQAVALPLILAAELFWVPLTIYFSISALAPVLMILGSDAPVGSPGQIDLLLLRHAQSVAVKNKWRRLALNLNDLILMALTWPILIFYILFLLLYRNDVMLRELRRKGRLRVNAFSVLYPYPVFSSMWLAATSISMHLIVRFQKIEPSFFDFVATMLIITIGFKQLAHLFGPATLQAMLRKAKAPVGLNYITVVVCDLVALILSYSIILSTLNGSALDLAIIKDIYAGLRSFMDVFGTVLNRPTEKIDYALGLSGLLWVSTLSKDLLNIPGYHRTTSDRCQRAFVLALCGFEADAKAEIKVLSPELDADIKVLAEAYTILGDLRQGRHLTRRFVRRKGELKADRDIDDITNVILLIVETLYHAGDVKRLSHLITFLKDHKLDSVQLLCAVISIQPTWFAEALKADEEQDGLLLAKAYVYWEAGDRNRGLRDFQQLLDSLKSTVSEDGDKVDLPIDADGACVRAVGLMMLEGLFSSEDELSDKVEEWLAEDGRAVQTVIQTEERFVALFAISAILMIAALRLEGRIRTSNLQRVLNLADGALPRMETTPITEDFLKDLDTLRSRLVETLSAAEAVGAAIVKEPEQAAIRGA